MADTVILAKHATSMFTCQPFVAFAFIDATFFLRQGAKSPITASPIVSSDLSILLHTERCN